LLKSEKRQEKELPTEFKVYSSIEELELELRKYIGEEMTTSK